MRQPTALLALALSLFAPGALAQEQELDALLAKLRAAVGIDAFLAGGRALELVGRGGQLGIPHELRLVIAPDGALRREWIGIIARTSVFDGRRAFEREAGAAPFELVLALREQLLLEAWLSTGYWLAQDEAIELRVLEGGPGAGPVLGLRLEGGPTEARLEIDPNTLRLSLATITSHDGTETYAIESWQEHDGFALPARLTHTDDAGSDELVFEALGAAATPVAFDRASLGEGVQDLVMGPAPAEGPPEGGAARPPVEVEVRTLRSGHPIVPLSRGGQVLGWALFDSGAGASVIDGEVALELELEPIGRSALGGAGGGRRQAAVVVASDLALGGLRLPPLVMHTMDLRALMHSDEDLVAILGWDLLIRCVAELDLAGGVLRLFDAARPPELEPGGDWTPIVLHGRHPCLRATFEGPAGEAHEGLFRYDTGAPGIVAIFHTPTVEALALADLERARSGGMHGAGGAPRFVPGRIAAIEGLGRRMERASVIFAADSGGALADPWSAGTLGGGLTSPAGIVFDYPRARMALRDGAGD